ncbi:GNAT family N-acetyltransferase [Paractinoplanes durhamensis]|uniref:GNAT family N-acetyltransferase n=1 Tax=Paractinoplanes durhamensis TaxID=113563 RepID=UPI00194412A0|nr:GNAT family N-acetyltransferase [Actinoplanes durhamensis]
MSGDLEPATATRAQIAEMLAAEADADGSETVVGRDPTGQVVGFAHLLLRHPVDGHPWIGLLMVDARLGRQGHGRGLVRAIEDRLRATAATAVRIGVLVANTDAQPFWAALGYRRIDLRPDRAKGRPTLIMENAL